MRKLHNLIVLFPLLLSLLACQTLTQPLLGWLQASPTPILTATPTHTLLATSSPTVSPTPTLAPTLEPTGATTRGPTATIAPTQLPTSLQLSIFEDLWATINDAYLYPDFNGQDWPAIHTTYAEWINTGLTNQEFYSAMSEMVNLLGDDHSVYLTPQEVADEDAEYAGNLNYVGIGALVGADPDNARAVILVVFPGSPAEEAGLRSRDSLLIVDGQDILDENGYLKDIVRGPAGTLVTLLVQSPGEQPRELTILRRPISGSLPVPYEVLTSPGGLRIGYIFLVGFTDSTVDEQVGQALQAMSADAPLDGLIIDNRQNIGGADTVVRPILSYFTSGVVGYFYSREEQRPLQIKLTEIDGSANLPLVVLIGQNTVSYGEIFSGVLQASGRAYLIGETTDGNVETLWGYDFEDGSRAWIAAESFRPANDPQADWEQNGIVPDLTVQAFFADFSLEQDPAVLAALGYFDSE